jgi:uncharacterized protein YecE (DUF72 family)
VVGLAIPVGAQAEAVSDGKPVSNVYYGTASWTDKTLLESGRFYPRDVDTPAERLGFYAERFPLVEVDSTYYALPSERNAALWIERTPIHFIFNIKAFALLTHHSVGPRGLPAKIRELLSSDKTRLYRKDLPPDQLAVVEDMFVSALKPLADAGRLGAILFQFPQWFVPSRENRDYLKQLAESFPYRIAVEFRGGGWMKDEQSIERTLALLAELGLTYVVVDEPQGFKTSVPPIVAATSPQLAMIRFHGHNDENWEKRGISPAERFRYLYSEDELEKWVEPAKELASTSEKLHILMNNCYEDYGVRNAAQIADLIAKSGASRP